VLANVHHNLGLPSHVLQGLKKLVYPLNYCLWHTGFRVTRQPLLQALQLLDHQGDILVLQRQTRVEKRYPSEM
jgi:hypothetical protein